MRTALSAFAWVWMLIIALVGVAALPNVNSDAQVFVVGAIVTTTVAAAVAGWAIRVGRSRLGGGLLVVSVAAPTFGAAAANLLPLVVGLVLVVFPLEHRAVPTAGGAAPNS